MEHAKGLTLEQVKKSAKLTDKTFRASDYLTEQELDEMHASNLRGKKIQRPYDEIDAFSAEILARFGFDAYQAWLSGKIDQSKMLRFIAAERARDKQTIVNLEALILASVSGANHGDRNGKAPKSLKHASKILKQEVKQAQGGQ